MLSKKTPSMATSAELFDLAVSYHRSGDLRQAEPLYRQVLEAEPGHAGAHHFLGLLAHQAGHHEAALALIRQALALNPDEADWHSNLGLVLMSQGRAAEAALCFRQALRLAPLQAEAHINLGNALKEQGELAQAALSYRHALADDPKHAGAYNNLGVIAILLRDEGRLEEATGCLRHQLAINPRDVGAHIGLSDALTRSGLYRDAMAHIEEALRCQPGFAPARCQRAHLRLLLGDFEGGWPDYESRWDLPNKAPRPFRRPRWDGSPLDGKTILVHAEQGLGDTIQFMRYLPLIQQRGGRVLFGCPPGLERLLGSAPERGVRERGVRERGALGIDQLLAAGAPIPLYDVQIPLLSLPGIFGTTLATIPRDVPYLRADPGRVEYWKTETESLDGFKVGVVWQGNPKNKALRHRSTLLASFEPLARVDGVNLVSLQVGPGTEQVRAAPFAIADLGSRFDPDSLADLAAVLVNLDLVVTIDTAAAHLAGALGVDVWTLLHFSPDWRWLLDRADSPWYPTMRLFRQSRFGDWGELFERVAALVKSRIAELPHVSPSGRG
jgi:Tfp pilus assembly protein PilF